MPSIRKQRHPPTTTVACYDIVKFFADQELDADTGCRIELRMFQYHALVLANLQHCLGRAPHPLSARLPGLEDTVLVVSWNSEDVYELRNSDLDRWGNGRSYS